MPAYTDKFSLIATLVMVILLIICLIGYKIVRTKHANDPEFQKRMAEKRREDKRIAQENDEIETYFSSDSPEYSDDDYEAEADY